MEEKIKKFEDLEVWREAHNIVLEIHKISENFPDKEIYGLTVQIKRAAISVPANIAEGFGRFKPKEKINFYNIALGSLFELRYFLILIKDLSYINLKKYESLYEKCLNTTKMLQKLIKSISKSL